MPNCVFSCKQNIPSKKLYPLLAQVGLAFLVFLDESEVNERESLSFCEVFLYAANVVKFQIAVDISNLVKTF